MVLIDGDIIVYRACYSGTSLEDCINTADDILHEVAESVQFNLDMSRVEVFLTGHNPPNFRKAIAKTAPYKGHRSTTRPDYFYEIREYLELTYDAKVSEGQEADDDIATRATQLGVGNCVICSIDKDFRQIPGRFYNWGTGEEEIISEKDALKNFYTQVLTGDSADNIKGAWMVGPKGADKLLKGCSTEEELYEATLQGYQGDLEALLENAQLVYLRREPNETWRPPNDTIDKEPDIQENHSQPTTVPDS